MQGDGGDLGLLPREFYRHGLGQLVEGGLARPVRVPAPEGVVRDRPHAGADVRDGGQNRFVVLGALLEEGFVFLIFSILARRHELLLAFLAAKLDIFSSLQPSEKKYVKNYKENLLPTIRNSFIIL